MVPSGNLIGPAVPARSTMRARNAAGFIEIAVSSSSLASGRRLSGDHRRRSASLYDARYSCAGQTSSSERCLDYGRLTVGSHVIHANSVGDAHRFLVTLACFADRKIGKTGLCVAIEGGLPQIGPVFGDHCALLALESHHFEESGSQHFLE